MNNYSQTAGTGLNYPSMTVVSETPATLTQKACKTRAMALSLAGSLAQLRDKLKPAIPEKLASQGNPPPPDLKLR